MEGEEHNLCIEYSVVKVSESPTFKLTLKHVAGDISVILKEKKFHLNIVENKTLTSVISEVFEKIPCTGWVRVPVKFPDTDVQRFDRDPEIQALIVWCHRATLS